MKKPREMDGESQRRGMKSEKRNEKRQERKMVENNEKK